MSDRLPGHASEASSRCWLVALGGGSRSTPSIGSVDHCSTHARLKGTPADGALSSLTKKVDRGPAGRRASTRRRVRRLSSSILGPESFPQRSDGSPRAVAFDARCSPSSSVTKTRSRVGQRTAQRSRFARDRSRRRRAIAPVRHWPRTGNPPMGQGTETKDPAALRKDTEQHEQPHRRPLLVAAASSCRRGNPNGGSQ